jgi:hypothetical protein
MRIKNAHLFSDQPQPLASPVPPLADASIRRSPLEAVSLKLYSYILQHRHSCFIEPVGTACGGSCGLGEFSSSAAGLLSHLP